MIKNKFSKTKRINNIKIMLQEKKNRGGYSKWPSTKSKRVEKYTIQSVEKYTLKDDEFQSYRDIVRFNPQTIFSEKLFEYTSYIVIGNTKVPNAELYHSFSLFTFILYFVFVKKTC